MDQRSLTVVDGGSDGPKTPSLGFSLLRLSAAARVAIVAVMVLALWAAVLGTLA